jgi:hypothetical protein
MTASPDRVWIERNGRVTKEEPEQCLLKWYAAYALLDGPTMQAAIAAAEARGRRKAAGVAQSFDKSIMSSTVLDVQAHQIAAAILAPLPADGGDT